MLQLSNDFLAITVNRKGAELSSVLKQESKIEYIWQADPAFWARHAPVLFPIVGRLKEDTYKFEGTSYQMKQHGFARDREFTLSQAGPQDLHFQLTADEESKKLYPFEFEFNIHYRLRQNQLEITYRVLNHDKKDLPFSIGAHPAFQVPIGGQGKYEEYELYFEQKETLDRYLLEEGLYTGERERVMTDTHVLRLERDMFDKDALVFQHPESSYVILRSQSILIRSGSA